MRTLRIILAVGCVRDGGDAIARGETGDQTDQESSSSGHRAIPRMGYGHHDSRDLPPTRRPGRIPGLLSRPSGGGPGGPPSLAGWAGSRRTANGGIAIRGDWAVDLLTVMAVLETQTERHLLRARDFIDAHYDEPINVSIVARAAYQSPAHFTRQFRKAFGETPHQYLLTRRMERAAALLRNTDYNVAQVCVSVGLSSVGSFTTAFRRAFGESPTHYRERCPSPFAQAMIPTCIYEAVSRPRSSRNRED